MKVANILTENQGQSFINSSILCALLVGIETLNYHFKYFLKKEKLLMRYVHQKSFLATLRYNTKCDDLVRPNCTINRAINMKK
jgi:hypothetical protein